MVCSNCGHELLEESKFCNKCGEKLIIPPLASEVQSEVNQIEDREHSEIEQSVHMKDAVEEIVPDSMDHKDREPLYKKRRFYLSSITMVIIAGLIVYFVVFLPHNKYNQAKVLLESNHFEEALSAFNELDSYKDSEKLIIEVKYQLAREYVSEYDYVEAIDMFEQIKEYKDSDSLLLETKYKEGLYQFEHVNGDVEKSRELFTSIKDYKDSKKYLNNIALIDSLQGEWVDAKGSGYRKLNFSGKEVSDSFSQSDEPSTYKWTLSVKDGEIRNEADYHYYIKNNKLYIDNGESISGFLRPDDPNIPKRPELPARKPSPKIGMTAEEVEASSWGSPKDINRTTTKYSVNEQWVYSIDRYIYLEDGVVTSIQD